MRRVTIVVLVVTSIFLGLILSNCSTPEKTQPSSEAYTGKNINMVIGSDAGGLIDLVGRVISNQLSTEIKGNVIVENRREAGGLESMNYLCKVSPDGLTLGIISPVKLLSNKILNDPAALYNIEDFSYIFKVDSSQAYFVVSTNGPYQTINDLKAGRGLKIAAGTTSGFNTLAGLTVIDILGLDAKVVTGFENNTARSLATQRGEVAGYAISLGGVRAELEAGTLKPLFVIAAHRDPVRQDIPAITELVNLSKDDLALVNLWENDLSSGAIFVAPGGIPEEKLQYLVSLTDKWKQNEVFCQEIDKASGYKVLQYTNGEVLTKSIHNMASALKSFQSRFAEMIEKYRS